MNVIAIDSSSRQSSVAVISGERKLAFQTSETLGPGRSARVAQGQVDFKRPGPAAMLTPLVESAIRESGLSSSDIHLFALTVGPGMFTGLRVSVVTAKAFAYATGAELIGVNTLEVLAAKAYTAHPEHSGPVRVAVNAQREQLFAGKYVAKQDWQVEAVEGNEILDQARWIDRFEAGDLVSGAGLKLVEDRVATAVEEDASITVAQESAWDCDAVAVAKVAIAYFRDGRRDDLWNLEPLYFRPSAAEEVQNARVADNDRAAGLVR